MPVNAPTWPCVGISMFFFRWGDSDLLPHHSFCSKFLSLRRGSLEEFLRRWDRAVSTMTQAEQLSEIRAQLAAWARMAVSLR